MSEQYIHPDRIFLVPVQGDDGGVGIELRISPAYDVLHHFSKIGGWIFKYWNDEENTLHDIMLEESGAQRLRDDCYVPVVERTWISRSEHEKLLSWRADHLEDLEEI